MPAYNLKCATCAKIVRRILPKLEKLQCDCGGQLERADPGNLSTQIKEVLDNGVMVRKVERLHNIEELVKERSKEPDGDDFI